MKKFFILSLGALLLVGCNSKEEETKSANELIGNHSRIIEITKNGETHEFLYLEYGGGLEHWPGCFFCNCDSLQNPEGNPD